MKKKSGITNFLFIFAILFLVISIIIFPKNSVDAALDSVNVWLFIVVPSLFPFFIGAELLIHSGLIDFIGIALEPIMYPLFRVSGKGSFVFAMSVTSGYPVGASLVSELRANESIGKVEAQRLVSLASTSGPLFIIGAVSIGMLKNPAAGTLLSISHYLGAITIGLIFRNYGKSSISQKTIYKDNYLKRFLSALVDLKNKKLGSIPLLMSNAIESAFKSLFMIGGFIIIYSVIIEILNVTSIIPQISSVLNYISPFKLETETINSVLSGLLEFTNGCKSISSLSLDLVWKLCIISFLIGWGGLSVHSQALSFMNKTDINSALYLLSKVFHGLFSSFYTYILYIFIFKDKVESIIVYNSPEISLLESFLSILKSSTNLGISTLFIMILISAFISIVLSIKNAFIK